MVLGLGCAAAAESRRQALATAGRGNTFPLARGEAAARRAAVRTLSEPVNSPTAAAGGGSGGAGAGEQQPQPPPRQDPFRVNMPASAFQVEERRPSTGGSLRFLGLLHTMPLGMTYSLLRDKPVFLLFLV